MIWVLAVILLFGVLPLLSLLLALAIALPFGCSLDEGSVHPCLIFGIDFGALVYSMSVSARFVMFTIPLAGVALVFWFVVILTLLFIRWRRQRQGKGTIIPW
jgi:hypothetical protein